MRKKLAKTGRNSERGMALLLTLFALLLLSGIGLFLVVSSSTETRIDANYGSGLRAYYAARSGLEEVRDRIRYTSTPATPWGLADKLPQDIAGNLGGVLYITNPASGETVDPTDPASPYFDDDLCHAYNSGTPKGVKCTMQPTTANWQMASLPSVGGGQSNYKWIRINMKTNRIVLPSFCVDQQADCTTAPLDTRVCWDGKTEQLSPGTGANASCDVNGMQTVYMLTALAVNNNGPVAPNAGRKLLQAEVVAPSIRPAGVLTAAAMNVSTSGTAVMPSVVIDGRAHDVGGVLVTPPAVPSSSTCHNIAPVGTDAGGAQLASALDTMRRNIVNTANNSCRADGSGVNGNMCTPGLWWVRGTDSSPRFVTTLTTSSSGSSGSSDGGSSGGSGIDGDHSGSTSGSSSSTTCNSTTPNCYTYLNLNSPQLFAISATSSPVVTLPSGQHLPTVSVSSNSGPFMGGAGNQSDSTIYQPGGTQTVADQVATVQSLVNASANQQSNITASSSTLASTYGSYNPPSAPSPVVVNFTDSTLTLQSGQSLTGYGVLMVPALEINSGATFNWTGIVLINSSGGHVTIGAGANGGINGALLLMPGAVFNTTTQPSNQKGVLPSLFNITYSCDAIDMVFAMQPFKVISSAETSF